MDDIYSRCERVLPWLGLVEVEEMASVDDTVTQLLRFETKAKSEGTLLFDVVQAFIQHSDKDVLENLRKTLSSIGRRP